MNGDSIKIYIVLGGYEDSGRESILYTSMDKIKATQYFKSALQSNLMIVYEYVKLEVWDGGECISSRKTENE